MTDTSRLDDLRQKLNDLPQQSDAYAVRFVDLLLETARELQASDIHLLPQAGTLWVKLRLDGVLHPVGIFPRGDDTHAVLRLKVMAGLLTYRQDVPQEGRLRPSRTTENAGEMRLSVFPSLHGERAVVRLFAAEQQFQRLDDLGLNDHLSQRLGDLIESTSGALIIAGPAGAGKTTTAYALLREIAARCEGRKALVSLEDPIESEVPEMAQSQVSRDGPFTFPLGLRSLMRQDPEVILVGEMRDRETAEIAFQAALTGHFVITTFHAGRAAGVISRLAEMGIEPYVLRSGVRAVLCQHLVRRLCGCSRAGDDPAGRLGLQVEQWREPVGCPECHHSGYRGRMLVAELLDPHSMPLNRQLLDRNDSAAIEQQAIEHGMTTRWRHAQHLVEQGDTSPAEIRRVFGLNDAGG